MANDQPEDLGLSSASTNRAPIGLDLPNRLPLLALRGWVIYPSSVVPLAVGREPSIRAVEEALATNRLLVAVPQIAPEVENPGAADLESVGTVVRVLRTLPTLKPLQILVEGVCAAKVTDIETNTPHFTAAIEPLTRAMLEPYDDQRSAAIAALVQQVKELLQKGGPANMPDDIIQHLQEIDDVGRLAEIIAGMLPVKREKALEILATADPVKRLIIVARELRSHIDTLAIQREVRDLAQTKVTDPPVREQYLRELFNVVADELAKQKPPHVFISYVRENAADVTRLQADLHARHIQVWLDKDGLTPGVRWRDAIRRAIQEGAFFLACFSSEYVGRTRSYMNEELALAVDELRQRPRDRPCIPVRLSDCDVPNLPIGFGETLRDIQHVDLFRDWSRGVEAISAILKANVSL